MEVGKIGLLDAPFDFGVARKGSGTRTRGVDEDPVEFGLEGQRSGGVQYDPRADGRNIADAPGTDITGYGQSQGRFERLKGFVPGSGAEIEIGVAGAQLEQRNDGLGTDVMEALVAHIGKGLLERRGSNFARLICSEMGGPAVEEPSGTGELGWEVGPDDGIAVDLSEHGVDEARGGAFLRFGQLDSFVNGGVRGNFGQIAKLEDGGAENYENRLIQITGIPAGVARDEEIELRLKAQTAKDDLPGQAGVALGELAGSGAQNVRCITSASDGLEHVECGAASR